MNPAELRRRMTPPGRLVLLAVLAGALLGLPAARSETGGGTALAHEQAMRLGERMYREGLLPSGEPMSARVQGDIEVDGTMFSCSSCHLRSGLGSVEGTVITQPASGPWLAKPMVGAEMRPESQARVPARLDPPPFRPAYTDETLARALWIGVDAGGRELHPAMPRYSMSEEDMAVLVDYLKQLSATFSPGVDDTTLRFATVVSDGVDEVDRRAMLETLQAHVRDHNSQTRHEERRAAAGPFYKEEKNLPYRRWTLDVWELKGARAGWREQLEAYERARPVFALLGGMVRGSWAPVHEFAEERGLPCLFPVTDLPVVSKHDWYTLYFSKGLYQEGETAARFLRRGTDLPDDTPVVQVLREDERGRALARGFAETRASMGLPPALERRLASGETVDDLHLSRLAEEHPGAVLVLWLTAADLAGLERLAAAPTRLPVIVLSTSLVGDPASVVPATLRAATYLTQPYSFPEDEKRSRLSVERWLEAKGLAVTSFDVQAKMYFAGWMLSGVVKKMRDEFYREYFLDILGMMRDQYYAIAVYPRLSFGPGQRYAAKGCYVVQLGDDPDAAVVRRSGWVVH